MKIYDNKPPQLQDLNQNVQKVVKQEAMEAPQKAAKTSASDRVDISSKAREIAEIMSVLSQMPDIRAEKVAEIKKAIESGNYDINPAKIAESILNEI
jgi:negative regulator of flagellin synthesis FlgM